MEDKFKAYNVKKIRQKYPKAYMKWGREDDNILRKEYFRFIKITAKILDRDSGAIRSRLKKLFKINKK